MTAKKIRVGKEYIRRELIMSICAAMKKQSPRRTIKSEPVTIISEMEANGGFVKVSENGLHHSHDVFKVNFLPEILT